ncbi:MAG: cytochrome P460 family protein [Candidatus Thiodiazotropha sp. (ex Dulcina madagascariensis)]|nr:cytochrome P460 family protein [Candidatus Thiodiazotropha sp. (ex Dulcina madagascariensis)]
MKLIHKVLIGSLPLIFFGSAGAEESAVPFPENYRNWLHVKSMLILPDHPLEQPFQGIHHIYANEAATRGMMNGDYADGAEIVFDLLNTLEKENTIQEGSRKLIGVMLRNKSRYAETGGWGFEAFSGDSKTERLVKDGGDACFGCHAPEESSHFVFSKLRH